MVQINTQQLKIFFKYYDRSQILSAFSLFLDEIGED